MTITATHPPSQTPTLEPPELTQSIVAAFQASAARVPDRVALRTPGGGVSLTWAQYAQAVERVAGALAGLGVGHGDRVAFLALNSPQLAICEVAALHLGAATVVLYVASPTATIEHILKDSDPRVLICEQNLVGRLQEVGHNVAHVVTLDGASPIENLPPPPEFSFQDAWQAVGPEDLLSICYTSGTTGRPKGVEWEHAALMGALDRFDLSHPEPDGCYDICFGPFAHVGERALGHWRSLMRGSTRTVCAAPTELPAALLDARPTFLWGAPRVWQALKSALESTLTPHEREVLDRSRTRLQDLAEDQAPAALDTEDERTLADLRARVGLDRVGRALTSAAPCPLAIQAHYHALGVPFAEFYAMSELGVPTSGALGGSDLGTVGWPTSGYEVALDHDGEVLVRTDSAARGYRNLPAETAETFGHDGFIRTGDIGALDERGRLRIIDRKKEFLIDEHGHNTAPAPIESALKSDCPLIGHVCLVGEGRPYLAALILLEAPNLASDPDAGAQVMQAIERLNATSDPRERIQRHTILTAPWQPGEELTETLKLRRTRIAEKHKASIQRMYEPDHPQGG